MLSNCYADQLEIASNKFVETGIVTLCHGDLRPVHVIIDSQNSNVTFLDFESSTLGDIAWDLSMITIDHSHLMGDLLKEHMEVTYDCLGSFWSFGLVQLLERAIWCDVSGGNPRPTLDDLGRRLYSSTV